jgi:hypothetical protein
MIRTVEAIIDEQGRVRLLEAVQLGAPRRALVTILEEEAAELADEAALLSEPALAEDWNRPEEDGAWSYLQAEKVGIQPGKRVPPLTATLLAPPSGPARAPSRPTRPGLSG